ncbi:unnamed protein product [Mucor hiemalis]
MAFARPAVDESVIPAGKIRAPRMSTKLIRRDDLPDLEMKPYNTTNEPTREEALAANGGDTKYKFDREYKDTDPMNDGHTKMDELNKKVAEKEQKKADKKAAKKVAKENGEPEAEEEEEDDA